MVVKTCRSGERKKVVMVFRDKKNLPKASQTKMIETKTMTKSEHIE
jgi:hypothetical protein